MSRFLGKKDYMLFSLNLIRYYPLKRQTLSLLLLLVKDFTLRTRFGFLNNCLSFIKELFEKISFIYYILLEKFILFFYKSLQSTINNLFKYNLFERRVMFIDCLVKYKCNCSHLIYGRKKRLFR